MKRIVITLVLISSLWSVSAQVVTPLDNVFKGLRDIMAGGITTTQGNYGAGRTTVQIQTYIGSQDFCSQAECGTKEQMIDSLCDVTRSNKINQEIKERMFSIIRRGLDSIMPMAEDCYHFESHHQGIDTIQYSICLHSGSGAPNKYNNKSELWYDDAAGVETASFSYTSKLKPCGKHTQGLGALKYSRTEPLPSGKSVPFDWDKYQNTIQPLLNQKGIISRKFLWTQDSMYNKSNNEYISAYWSDSPSGKTNGTLYFIPNNKQTLALSLLKELNSTTLNYIHTYPEQEYIYSYNVNFIPITISKESIQKSLLETWGTGQKKGYDYYIFVCSDIRGYYIIICETKGTLFFPKEWAELKSIINGKKTYFKGMKPKNE